MKSNYVSAQSSCPFFRIQILRDVSSTAELTLENKKQTQSNQSSRFHRPFRSVSMPHVPLGDCSFAHSSVQIFSVVLVSSSIPRHSTASFQWRRPSATPSRSIGRWIKNTTPLPSPQYSRHLACTPFTILTAKWRKSTSSRSPGAFLTKKILSNIIILPLLMNQKVRTEIASRRNTRNQLFQLLPKLALLYELKNLRRHGGPPLIPLLRKIDAKGPLLSRKESGS